MPNGYDIFNRTALLVGSANMARIQQARVILFGVGGVGSWCAEGLVRSGIQHLTLVDSDCISPSNINRQLMATTQTVGQVKVEAMRQHLLAVNPDADISALQASYTPDTAESFGLESYDYVIDAIDSLSHKAHLLHYASGLPVKLYSSMGAALKCDPTKVAVAKFKQVEGCPLARALRKRFKSTGLYPQSDFWCVYSPEVLENLGAEEVEAVTDPTYRKAQVNGTMAHITAIFGMTLAGIVLQHIIETKNRD
ncbi:MAG: tRNA threonylcarbamoyladenosine dehydratase [Bacteroidales bacterium]|nr:tRNA threonylcarbamoyladenosine dehydratase [Bacteroidales bacterium]